MTLLDLGLDESQNYALDRTKTGNRKLSRKRVDKAHRYKRPEVIIFVFESYSIGRHSELPTSDSQLPTISDFRLRKSKGENLNIRLPTSEVGFSNIRPPTRKSDIKNSNIRLPNSKVVYSFSDPSADL